MEGGAACANRQSAGAKPYLRSQLIVMFACASVAVHFEKQPSADGEAIVRMEVWLQTEEGGEGESLRFRFVRSPQQATAMSQDKAREAMQGVKRDYPQCTWEMESWFKSGEFIVHGHKK
jgi:hypothetical protein